MAEDQRGALTEDIVDGVTHGEVAAAHDPFSIERRDDGTVLEVDFGDPVYVVTVSTATRRLMNQRG